MSVKPILILGGGPTGLAAAYRLSEMKKPFVLIEKENNFGGLSATCKYKDYLYEYGPHAFHLKDEEITRWLQNLLGKNFRIIPTDTQVFINGQLFAYPLKAKELLQKINPILGTKMILGYLWENIKKLFVGRNWENFEEWGIANFGKTLYKISFGDYTAKVWGLNPKELSAKLSTGKLSKLNLRQVLSKAFGFKGKPQPLFFKKYLYPKKGMAEIFYLMSKKIEKGGKVYSGSEVSHLKTKDHKIVSVEFYKNGVKSEIVCDKVISTFPINKLVKMVNQPLSYKSISAVKKLNFRDLVIVYIVVDDKNLPKAQWIYLVENKFRFNRVSINKNLSEDFSVHGKTLLAFEICCQKDDKIWKLSDKKLLEIVKTDMEKLYWGNLKIYDFFVKRLENAYPIYLIDFEKNVDLALDGVSEIKNLFTTGRNGLFLNSDIHDCFEMGFEAAVYAGNNNLGNWKKKVEKWLDF